VIIFLGGITWIGSHELDPAQPLESTTRPLEIDAVSLDWKWLFIYPAEQVASINELYIPVNRPVHFFLTSASVMNVFFVPQLGSMIYTMNRMITQLYLQADHMGDYYGRSAHFSGDGFPGMQFTVHAVPADLYDSWIRATQQTGPVLDEAAYAKLQQQSANVPPSTYRFVQSNLFQLIANQTVPPSPGPLGVVRPKPLQTGG
jgi:cytochrome o ubiquinol oxidase subunit 2